MPDIGSGWAGRLAGRRAVEQRVLLLVVALVALLAGTTLAGLAMLLTGIDRYAVPGAVERLDPEQTSWQLDLDLRGADVAEVSRTTDALVQRVFRAPPTHTVQRIGADAVSIPRKGVDALFFASSLDEVADHAELRAGRWPRPGVRLDSVRDGAWSEVEVAIPRSAAKVLRLRVGSVVEGAWLRLAGGPRLVVSGVYDITDPDSDYWAGDPFHATTHDPSYVVPFTSGLLTTDAFGPVVVDEGTFSVDALPAQTFSRWLQPDLSQLRADEVAGMRARLGLARVELPSIYPKATSTQVTSQLPDVLERMDRSLFVTRVSVLVTALMVLVLALVGLLQATRLLAERRTGEQALMRARGAARGHLVRLASVEAVVLGALVVLVAPYAARGLYLLLAAHTGLERAGLAQDPGLPASAWLAAGLTAVLLGGVLVAPMLRRERTFVEQQTGVGRQDVRSALTRSGLDLAIVALGALAYWQLRSYESPLITTATGRLTTDPILVAGPALCLLGGTLLAIRLVPVIARGAEALATRVRSLAVPMAAWEVARRSRRASSAVLLLTMALATATFSLTYLSSWNQSLTDQADVAVGTDGRVTDPPRPALATSGALASIPEAASTLPVLLREGQLFSRGDFSFDNPTASAGDLTVVAADPQRMPDYLRGRVNEDPGIQAALESLTPAPEILGLPLPGNPTTLRATVRSDRPPVPTDVTMAVRAVLQDADGVREVVELGRVPADGRRHVVTARLMGIDSRGRDEARLGLRPAGPLELLAVQAYWFTDTPQPPDDGTTPRAMKIAFEVGRVRVREGTGASQRLQLAPTIWTANPTITPIGFGNAAIAESVVGTASGNVMLSGTMRALTETVYAGVGAAWISWEPDAAATVVATPAALAKAGVRVGERAVVVVDRTFFPVVVSRSSDVIPGVPRGTAAIMLDDDVLTRTMIERGSSSPFVDEWWSVVAPADAQAYVDTAEQLGLGDVTARTVAADDARTDPLRIGVQGALALVVVAAALLAAAGFALNTTTSVRLRRVEFAELRALGATRRAVSGVIAMECLLLGLIGALCGVALGLVVAGLVEPLVALTAPGAAPVPDVVVSVPWPQVLGVLVLLAALLAVVTAGVTSAMRRTALGGVLRLGDER